MQKTIDASGWQCPKPIIEAKKALKEIDSGAIKIITDNTTALNNLLGFAKSSGYKASHEENNGRYYITIEKALSCDCSAMPLDKAVIVIKTNILGQGSDELGLSLMKSYIFALTELEKKPETLIFMNSGVFLTTQGSPVCESLELLEAAGVEILSCGTCLDFFNLSDKLLFGRAGNMYTFAEKMSQASNTLII